MKYPADDGESQDNTIFGIDISASDLGNVNYGVVGAALDIPDNMLFWQTAPARPKSSGSFAAPVPRLRRMLGRRWWKG